MKTLTKANCTLPTSNDDLTKLILNAHNSEITSDKLENISSKLCYVLHKRRYNILKEKDLLFRKKKRDECISCSAIVKTSNQAIQCSICQSWQHARCGDLNISRRQYQRIKDGLETFEWNCMKCIPDNKCIHCKKIIPDDAQAIQCDKCLKWQHIRCKRIMKVSTYLETISGTIPDVPWKCSTCTSKA